MGTGVYFAQNSRNIVQNVDFIITFAYVTCLLLLDKCWEQIFLFCGGDVSPTYQGICLTSVTRVKYGIRSTLCWKIGIISGPI